MNVPDPDNVYIKTHEDLVSEFGISQRDRRKYNFLLKNIPSDWLDKPGFLNFNIYDHIIENLNRKNLKNTKIYLLYSSGYILC